MKESYIILLDKEGLKLPPVRLKEVDHIVLVLETFTAFIEENAPFEQEVIFCFPTIKANGKKGKDFFEHELFAYIIKQYPDLRPEVLKYVQSINETIIGDCDAPLGLFPVTALAIYDSQYLSHFENALFLHKKIFEKEVDDATLFAMDIFMSETLNLLHERKWDINAIEFLIAWIVWNGSIGGLYHVFSPKIPPKDFNKFMKAFEQKMTESDWYEKYGIFEILEAVFREVHCFQLEKRFKKCIEEDKVPTYNYLKKGK